ncbi:DNA helicase RecQ [Carboxylicivirga sp. N1Y90]|uniref:DNA helicase RecQ n=1 Tax=Carboxylicivirga fragile TaxID=3417571 RepID=UPI003D33CAB4|nr:DNA helicase RecQ [Marinilabiliaceae bacterium N1Y90]
MAKQVDLNAHLKKHFGFDTFKGNQEEVINNVLNGNDTFVLMPTGGGKSLCYQLPALILPGTAIVISPLIALMKNQVDAMRNFSEDNGIAHFLNSSLTKTAIAQVKEDILAGKTKLLYVAPESLTKEENIEFLKQIEVSFYAVDEAHCISEWGHDFRPEYRRIRPIINDIGESPLIALTATATPKVQHDIQKNLGMLNAMVFKASFNRPNLFYEIRPKQNPSKEIIKILKNYVGKSAIIYCLSRKKVEELAETLVVNGLKALPYHAGMDASTRAKNQDAFLMEETDVIVATIAFGMGIDKPDVRVVMHYDIPKSLEGYYQETGRAGRDGGEGRCIAFYSYKDIQKLEKFMQGKPLAEQEIGKQLLLETVSYAESSVCRRKTLLHYFGEKYTVKDCETCDNCVNPKEEFEAKESVLKILNTILEFKERFKSDHIINILIGNKNTAIKAYKHNDHKLFGSGDEYDEKHWNAVVRQSLVRGLIIKDIETYGLLHISTKGHEFIKSPESIMMSKDHDFDTIEEETSNGGTAAVDTALFSMLKDLRKNISKKLNLPPFVIFQDPSLEAMSTYYPITIDELQNIPGVGTGKANRFGKDFIKLINRHVEENEIDRPMDMVVKSIANKSKLKISIIQSIDRQMPLNEVADSKGIEMFDLIKELESIVYSGTRVNIDYYIDQVIDEDIRDDIFYYFKEEAETDDISAALEELGEDTYSEEDIRLVRIKFISEVGN